MFCCINLRYCWPIPKLSPIPWFYIKRKTHYLNCITESFRYNQIMNLFLFNRRSTIQNLLISIKVNKSQCSFCYFLHYYIPLIFFLLRGKRLRWRRWNWQSFNRRWRKWWLISDGACAINLRLDRFISSRWSVAYPCLCFLKLTVPRQGLFELYSGSCHPDFLNDFKAILTQ